MRKRRAIIMVILIFSSLFVLGAQTRPSIAVRALSGGSGNDGELIAVMLSTQRVIQNNFTITDGASDYVITGTIVRDGLGHIAHIVIYRGGTEIGRESLFYRAFIEVSAYMPTVASNLARLADSSIAAPSNARSLPQAPEAPAVAAAPPAPAPRPVTPPAATPPMSTPAPAPTQRLPLPTQRVPVPQPDTGEEEESSRRGPPTPMTIYTGAYLGIWGIGLEAAWFPHNGGLHWLGYRLGFGSWRGGSSWDIWAAPGSLAASNFTETHNGYGSVFTVGPMAKFQMGMFDLGLHFGFATGGLNFDEYNVTEYMSVRGLYWGTDLGMQLGPGVIYATINGTVMWAGDHNKINRNIYAHGQQREFFLWNTYHINLGVGYRIGFSQKPPRE